MKTTAGKIEDLENKLAESRQPLGQESQARTFVDALFADGTFVETDALARHRSKDFGREHDRPYTDGVITGYGTIDGRKVCAWVQDDTIFDGTMGEVYGEKLVKLYDLAIKTGVPMIAVVTGEKPRAQEGIVSLALQARVLERATQASGLIPQVTVAYGDSLIAAQSDIVLPRDVEGTDYIKLIRQVLSYLPSNNRAEAPRAEAAIQAGSIVDNVTEADRALNEATSLSPADIFADTLELQPGIAGAYTGFGRLEGRTVGVVAFSSAAPLDDAAAAKAARFIRLCDSFNTPVVEIVDGPELTASSPALAQLIHAYAAATVGKITVITGPALGLAYVALGAKDLGADLAYAWPGAEIAVAPAADLAAELGMEESAAAEAYLTPYQAAERNLVDAVIEPATTRGYLIEGLRLLERKLVHAPAKKHGNIVL